MNIVERTIEAMEKPNKITFFQLVGWYPNIKPENRRQATISDGATFSSKKLAEIYATFSNITISSIKKHCREISDADKNHIDCFLKPPYLFAECCNGVCGWQGSYFETVHPKHNSGCLHCPECYEVVELVKGS